MKPGPLIVRTGRELLSIRKYKKPGLGESDPRNRLPTVADNRIDVKDVKRGRIGNK
jgi:hypothetical protein